MFLLVILVLFSLIVPTVILLRSCLLFCSVSGLVVGFNIKEKRVTLLEQIVENGQLLLCFGAPASLTFICCLTVGLLLT